MQHVSWMRSRSIGYSWAPVALHTEHADDDDDSVGLDINDLELEEKEDIVEAEYELRWSNLDGDQVTDPTIRRSSPVDGYLPIKRISTLARQNHTEGRGSWNRGFSSFGSSSTGRHDGRGIFDDLAREGGRAAFLSDVSTNADASPDTLKESLNQADAARRTASEGIAVPHEFKQLTAAGSTGAGAGSEPGQLQSQANTPQTEIQEQSTQEGDERMQMKQMLIEVVRALAVTNLELDRVVDTAPSFEVPADEVEHLDQVDTSKTDEVVCGSSSAVVATSASLLRALSTSKALPSASDWAAVKFPDRRSCATQGEQETQSDLIAVSNSEDLPSSSFVEVPCQPLPPTSPMPTRVRSTKPGRKISMATSGCAQVTSQPRASLVRLLTKRNDGVPVLVDTSHKAHEEDTINGRPQDSCASLGVEQRGRLRCERTHTAP